MAPMLYAVDFVVLPRGKAKDLEYLPPSDKGVAGGGTLASFANDALECVKTAKIVAGSTCELEGPIDSTLTYAQIEAEKANLFKHPTDGDHDLVTFEMTVVNSSDNQVATCITALADKDTGWAMIKTTGAEDCKGNFTAIRKAFDRGNTHNVTISEWPFSVVVPPVFKIHPDFVPQHSGDKTLLVDTVQKMSGPGQATPSMFVDPALNDFESVIYTLNVTSHNTSDERDGIDLAVVDQQTGKSTFNFEKPGRYDVQLGAVDDAGAEVVVEQWTFTVPAPQTFGVNMTSDIAAAARDAVRSKLQDTFSDPDLHAGVCATSGDSFQCDIAENATFLITGFDPDTVKSLFTNPVSNDYSSITFQINGCAENCVCYTNPGNGDSSCTWSRLDRTNRRARRESVQPQRIEMVGRDRNGLTATLLSWNVSVYPGDTSNPKNGPNGMGCQNGGAPIDAVPLDGNFDCSCTAQSGYMYTGENCEKKDTTADEKKKLEQNEEILTQKLREQAIEIQKEHAETVLAQSRLEESQESSTIGGAVGGGVVVIVLALIVLAYRRQKYKAHDFKKQIKAMIENGELTEDEALNASGNVRVPREIARKSVKLGDMIGAGNFGTVHLGQLQEKAKTENGDMIKQEYDVAIKSVKVEGISVAERAVAEEELLSEATVMTMIDPHPNIVSLIGVVTRGTPLRILVSLCSKGSVLSLVSRGKPFKPERKLAMISDISNGMVHLTKHNIVHRDLAARNILVDSLDVCKIADFGLSRVREDGGGEYYKSSAGIFPARWTSPEAMSTMKYTTASDCWSFGIVVCEIFGNGETPYATWDLATVIKNVQAGERMDQPRDCPLQLYALLLECWHSDANLRPSFSHVHNVILTLIDPDHAAPVRVATSNAAVLSSSPRRLTSTESTIPTSSKPRKGSSSGSTKSNKVHPSKNASKKSSKTKKKKKGSTERISGADDPNEYVAPAGAAPQNVPLYTTADAVLEEDGERSDAVGNATDDEYRTLEHMLEAQSNQEMATEMYTTAEAAMGAGTNTGSSLKDFLNGQAPKLFANPCPECGINVVGRFCGSCGAKVRTRSVEEVVQENDVPGKAAGSEYTTLEQQILAAQSNQEMYTTTEAAMGAGVKTGSSLKDFATGKATTFSNPCGECGIDVVGTFCGACGARVKTTRSVEEIVQGNDGSVPGKVDGIGTMLNLIV